MTWWGCFDEEKEAQTVVTVGGVIRLGLVAAPRFRIGSGVANAIARQTAHFPADLQRVIDLWPTLPQAVRRTVLELVRRSDPH
jgi:hypothetical protein